MAEGISAFCPFVSALLVSTDIQVSFFEVESERHAVEHGHVANDTLYLDMAASRWRAVPTTGQHGNLAGAVLDFIHFERHKGHAPGARHSSVDGDRSVGVVSRVSLDVCDVGIPQDAAARREHEC